MKQLLTPKKLAERWDIDVGTLANLRDQGRGPAWTKLGDRKNSPVRYRLEDIEKYELDRQRQPDNE